MLTRKKMDNLLKSGNWMIRMDDNGVSYNGFKWKPKGQWTEAPDWNTAARCEGGLFGQSPKGRGFAKRGKRLVLCETKGEQIVVENEKVKVRYAKIIAINSEIPPIFLERCGGSLDLGGCDLKGITLPQSVGGSLDLRGCDLKGITLPQSVGGSLDLRGCDLKGITLPQSVCGLLDLSGCDLKGITLPQSVGGSLYLSGCDLKGITLPSHLKPRVITY